MTKRKERRKSGCKEEGGGYESAELSFFLRRGREVKEGSNRSSVREEEEEQDGTR